MMTFLTAFKPPKWFTSPITVFVVLQIIWVSFTVMWVLWFVNRESAIAELARAPSVFSSDRTLATLVAGIVLLVLILVGITGLFVWGKKQQKLNRQQKQFVSSVTHELRSPLASLRLSYETLILRNLPIDMQQQLHQMSLRDIDRLSKLVDQILISAQLDRGILMFQEGPSFIVIGEKIRDIVASLLHLDPYLEARVTIEGAVNCEIFISSSALTLVLTNILENAIKYSPKDLPIQIKIAAIDGVLVISVKDQGIGLEKKERAQIFKMFHRGAYVIRKSIPGTGLGLYIVRSALNQLGGGIEVESPGRGQGTTFSISLPLFEKRNVF